MKSLFIIVLHPLSLFDVRSVLVGLSPLVDDSQKGFKDVGGKVRPLTCSNLYAHSVVLT